MSIIGVIPDPETAATVVAWVQALAEKDEETKYLCLECGFDGQTGQAVRGVLGQTGGSDPTLVAIEDHDLVVTGSMLLAPLMTPMIGLGLALGQAHMRMMHGCGNSIGLGFLLTLAVSYLVGILTPAGETLSAEVLAHGVSIEW